MDAARQELKIPEIYVPRSSKKRYNTAQNSFSPLYHSLSKRIMIQAGNRVPFSGDLVDATIEDRTIPHA